MTRKSNNSLPEPVSYLDKKREKWAAMEDRRIMKTRRNIKKTLIELLAEMPFEKITVSELCRRGETSRITFYNYYESKYALVEEMFGDYIREANEEYHRLQNLNNPENTAVRGYHNMLDCILNICVKNEGFFASATPERNPYLYSAFFRHTFASVDTYIRRHTSQIRPRHDARKVAALICSGLWGVVSECYADSSFSEEVRRDVHVLFQDILTSAVFEKTEGNP